MNKTLVILSALFLASGTGFAGETRLWVQSDAASFQKGNLKGIAVRSDGHLSLAPKNAEIYDASIAYLWALVRDSHGNLYTGGGPGAKLFRIAPDGKGEKLAEFDALEIHALAIDSKDHLYVATGPDGKIYRVDAKGVSTEFYAPGQKYIWAMVCDAAGNLYVATGDKGEVHKVTPDGKGSVFFRTEETHARSLALDHDGNLIVGTEPGGLVIRVSPAGESFVLHQMAKREVTALVVGPQNEVYAAAVGTKAAPVLPAAAPALAAPAPPAIATTGSVVMVPLAPAAPAAPAPLPSAGGAEVFRIPAKSSPVRVWTGAQDFVYALALDAGGNLLIGSGNKGTLYRVDSPSLYTTLLNVPVAQVTALLTAPDGAIVAATGNVGKVFRAGPGLEAEGTIESDVFDATGFASWGRLSAEATLNGGSVRLAARSGNLDRPQKNWSPWSAAVNAPDGGSVTVPGARFLQWKATLAGANSPVLESVTAAYLRDNIAPRVDTVEATPANYRFPAPAAPATISISASPSTLTLPAIGTPAPPRAADAVPGFPSLTYSRGWQGVRWVATDENGDSLIFRVEIRGDKEKNWKLLRDKVTERYYSFDSSVFPDGDYRIRVTASDAPSNPPEAALTGSGESEPFTVDNTPPKISGLRQAANGAIEWRAADDLTTIRVAEYSLDGGDWTVVEPVSKLSDAKALDYRLALTLTAGEHTVAVRVADARDNVAVEKLVLMGH